jgi:hypothetical protein
LLGLKKSKKKKKKKNYFMVFEFVVGINL